VLDALIGQVHGEERRRPRYLDPRVELIVGDVRDAEAVRRALSGVDLVFHLAAAVGVGQSMYQIEAYSSTNTVGTAVLLEALIKQPVERVIVASSMSVYGEGLYRDRCGRSVPDARRTSERLATGAWDPVDAEGHALEPIPTPESKPPCLESVYALTKFDQEQLVLTFGRAYGVPCVALRLFNVYGARQALSNPYTGVMAIFASRLMNDKPPVVFEDGQQLRDFVHVRDVARAFSLAAESPAAAGQVLNVASGQPHTIRSIAEHMARALDVAIEPAITGQYRAGDIRHCAASIERARAVLGYAPSIALERGLEELCEWIASQTAVDRFDQMRDELIERRLAG
jgi:dTDP-L-rhamnose 4-epimerase